MRQGWTTTILSSAFALCLAVSALAQPIPPYPYANEAEIALAPFGAGEPGITAEAGPPTIQNIVVKGKRGPGLVAHNEARIIDCYSIRNWIGAKLTSSDTRISGCHLVDSRDVGLWIARDAGNCYSFANHCYGSRISGYNEGGAWFGAVRDTYADALIGFYANAESTLTGCIFQHNTVADCVVYGKDVEMVGCTVMVQAATNERNKFTLERLPLLKPLDGKLGVFVGGDRYSMNGGRVNITNWIHPVHTRSGKPAAGFVVAADDCEIRTRIADTDQIAGTTAILIQGNRRGLVVDCWIDDFDDPASVLKFAPGASMTGLDVTLRVGKRPPEGSDPPLKLGEFLPPKERFSGVVRVIDVVTGKRMEATGAL